MHLVTRFQTPHLSLSVAKTPDPRAQSMPCYASYAGLKGNQYNRHSLVPWPCAYSKQMLQLSWSFSTKMRTTDFVEEWKSRKVDRWQFGWQTYFPGHGWDSLMHESDSILYPAYKKNWCAQLPRQQSVLTNLQNHNVIQLHQQPDMWWIKTCISMCEESESTWGVLIFEAFRISQALGSSKLKCLSISERCGMEEVFEDFLRFSWASLEKTNS